MLNDIKEWLLERLLNRQVGRDISFETLFGKFREILSLNNRVLELIAGANDKLGGDYIFDRNYIETTIREITSDVKALVYALGDISGGRYMALRGCFDRIEQDINDILAGRPASSEKDLVLPYSRINKDFINEVGGKNASIAQVGNYTRIKIPEGFAITARAFYTFMDTEDLGAQIKEVSDAWNRGVIPTERASSEIRNLIQITPLPQELQRAINDAVKAVKKRLDDDNIFFAVRSSAWGEDSEHSFAGQYHSALNVPGRKVVNAYKEVVASLFNVSAMEYRRHSGFLEEEAVMPVACQHMIDAVSSGVMYTYDPVKPSDETMVITSTWGLGAPVVSGRVSVDRFVVTRRIPHEIKELQIVHKPVALHLTADGGTCEEPVQFERQEMPSLTTEQIFNLAETGIIIEKNFRKPQDIEFSFDNSGELVLLQTRQLTLHGLDAPSATELADIRERYEVILEGEGITAQSGIASGIVHIVKDEKDLHKFPAGAILAAPFATPKLAEVLHRAGGLVTDTGSVTGHLATVAREYRVPALFNCKGATDILKEGEDITLDADEAVIYRGHVKELQYYHLAEESIGETYEYRLLRRLLKKIEPLNLTDPSEKNFKPESCQTLHDITRFVHEKAVDTIIDFNYYNPVASDASAAKLKMDIPLDLIVIDIGGGLREGVELSGKHNEITPEDLQSRPMIYIVNGMKHPGAWSNAPVSVDMSSFMSSLSRTFSAEFATPRQVGQNLAVISSEYVNLSLRLGYHFTMIDAYVSDNINDNYAYFRFFGGVTGLDRRARRGKFIEAVLSDYHFRTSLQGDLVVGRIKKLDEREMLERLYLLGLLVSITRQLDVKMVNDGRIAFYKGKIKELMEEYHGK